MRLARAQGLDLVFYVKTDDPLRAGLTELEGRIWPTAVILLTHGRPIALVSV